MHADVARSRQLGGLAVLFVAGFIAITTETLPMGLLPAMSRSLHVSEASVGLLAGGYALVVLIVTLPLVAWTSRWRRRRVLLVVMSGFVVSNVVTALAPSYPVAMVARFVAALGHGVLWSTMPAYAALLVAPHRAGRAIAIVFAANSASLTLGVPLGTVVGDAAGWRVPFAGLALLAVVVMLLAGSRLPDLPGEAERMPAIRDAARLPALRRILAATGLVMLGHFALYTFIAPVLLDAGLSEGQLGPALFAFGLAGIAGVVAAGTAVDRAPRTALQMALVAMALSTATLVATGDGAAVVATAVWGAAYAALPTLLQTETLRAAPHLAAAASALFIITFNLSITAGAYLGSHVLESSGSAPLPLLAAILAAAAAAWVTLSRGPGTRDHHETTVASGT